MKFPKIRLFKPRIIVRLYGGLGNQLFQYFYARSLQRQTGLELFVDLNWFSESNQQKEKRGITPRNYSLPFILKEKPNEATRWQMFCFSFVRKLTKLFRLFAWKWEPVILYKEEKLFQFQEQHIEKESILILDGHWQHKDYIERDRNIFQKESQPFISWDKIPVPSSEVQANTSVALHIRRGDYLSNPDVKSIHGVVGEKYFEKSLRKLNEYFTVETLFIFSDDPEVQFSFFSKYKLYRVSDWGLHDFEEFLLFSQLQNRVISNSSFSWWASFLGSPDGLTILPKPWFHSLPESIPAMKLQSWTLVETE